ncbi:unnamed protein product [Blepharisma stoltei]|uniref:Protein SFI1 homolog n=1 Tax=Blepharisma stoltei TaxID=1481888 RepID=A0AAU9J8R1_9CILI|nr:unnamed protein product [Blepharisma stoltei]
MNYTPNSSFLTTTPEPGMHRSLLKFGGGLKYTSSIEPKFPTSSSKSYTNLQFSSHSPIIFEKTKAYAPNILPKIDLNKYFDAWKLFVVKRLEAKILLADDFRKLRRKIVNERKISKKNCEKQIKNKIFINWKSLIIRNDKGSKVLYIALKKVFNSWRKYVLKSKNRHFIYWKVQEQLVLKLQYQFWSQWRIKFLRAQKIRQLFNFAEVVSLNWAFRTWIEECNIQIRLDRILKKSLRKLKSLKQRSILKAWKNSIKERRRISKTIKKYLIKNLLSSKIECLHLWKQKVNAQKILKKCLLKRKSRLIKACMLVWYKNRFASFTIEESIKLAKSYIEDEIRSEYEQKINDLRAKLEDQNQEFLKEKQHMMEKQKKMKTILSSHAGRLYDELCPRPLSSKTGSKSIV